MAIAADLERHSAAKLAILTAGNNTWGIVHFYSGVSSESGSLGHSYKSYKIRERCFSWIAPAVSKAVVASRQELTPTYGVHPTLH